MAVAVYAAAVLSLTVFPLEVTYGIYANQSPWYGQISFIPLLTADVTMIPNVIMLIPAGFLLPLLSRRATSARRTTLLTGAISLGIEAAQLLSYIAFNNGRSVDVNDVIANALGGLLGYLLLTLALRSESLRRPLLAASLPRSAACQQDQAEQQDQQDQQGRSVAAGSGEVEVAAPVTLRDLDA
jgi:glycopeptide antibiotics resistance protein